MSYLFQNPLTVLQLLLTHLQLVGSGILVALPLAIGLALLVNTYRWLALPLLSLLGVLYTIPSLALMILLIPWSGLGTRTVILAIAIYAQVLLVRQLLTGLNNLPPETLEAARGMGMNRWQQWWQVQLPLLLPVLISGLRLAVVAGIAIATLGAKFGAGGLGVLLFDGLAQAGRKDKIWAGAIVVALLALSVDLGLRWLEQWQAPRPEGKSRESL